MKHRIAAGFAKTALWLIYLLGIAASFICVAAGVAQTRGGHRGISEQEALTELWDGIIDGEMAAWLGSDIAPRYGITAELYEMDCDGTWRFVKSVGIPQENSAAFSRTLTTVDENGAIVKYKLTGMYDPDAFSDVSTELQRIITRAVFRLPNASLAAVPALALSVIAFAGAFRLADRPGPLHRVPFDLLVLLAILFAATEIATVFSGRIQLSLPIFLFDSLLAAAVLLGLTLSCKVRRKSGHMVLVSSSVWRFLRRLPTVWRTALALLVLAGAELAVIPAFTVGRGWLWLWIPRTALIFAVVLTIAMAMRRLAGDARALAQGDLTHVADTKGLFGDFRRHAEDLNRISGTMTREVEQRMRSERMKTELITNVSHDLKTPLTSIVNYASLIGREECESETVRAYASVLVRQSEKLKRLIEDLMEVSKAVTGNLEVSPELCGASVFLAQTEGEYGDRLAASSLTLCLRLPEEELYIMADSRRMWRVFDNLMGNICKYAMENTRVYLSLEREDGMAVFTFRNTSREPLTADPSELTERFVRGDASRNSDGSGLGLSIAKSLTELQGGAFRLTTDGDLFKVTLRFPLAETQEATPCV